MIEAGARYHLNCYNYFIHSPNKGSKIYEGLLNFIDQCVHDHLAENVVFKKKLSEYPNNENRNIILKYVKKLLADRLQDDVYVASNKSGQYVLWKRDLGND